MRDAPYYDYFYEESDPYLYDNRKPVQPQYKSNIIVCEYCRSWYLEARTKCINCGATISLNYAQLLDTNEWRIP